MIRTGLVSVTFRQRAADDIVGRVARAQLDGIEWGGDIHVPHGDVARAGEVGRVTRDAGLHVAAYGSYYRLGVSEAAGLAFTSVLDSAVALEAPVIRVWVGDRGSADVDAAYRAQVTEDALRVAAMADKEGITIACEWHVNTLTDTLDSSLALLREAVHPRLKTLWQPATDVTHAACLDELAAIRDRLGNIHVYHLQGGERRPLREGAAPWREYLEAANADGTTRYALLEFVRDDSPDAFTEDAEALKDIVASLQA